MAADVVIHFLGLCVWTQSIFSPATATARLATQSAIQTGPAVAIMPLVPLPSGGLIARAQPAPPQAFARVGGGGVVVSPTVGHTEVEPHKAVIVFRGSDLISSHGWDINHLNDDFLYIELNHDRITFSATGQNGPASLAGQQLYHIPGTLLADYGPPGYAAAAAVFTVPSGTLKACASGAPGTDGQRRDMELTLKNSGSVSINSGSKILTLKEGSTAYAANAPLPQLAQHQYNTDPTHPSMNHYLVYCWMTGATSANCQPPVPGANDHGCTSCSHNENLPPPPGGGNNQHTANAYKIITPESTLSTSFECSNTMWP